MRKKRLSISKVVYIWKVCISASMLLAIAVVLTASYLRTENTDVKPDEVTSEMVDLDESEEAVPVTEHEYKPNVSHADNHTTEYVLLVTMCDPITGDPVYELPNDVPSAVLSSIKQYAYDTMNINNYVTCKIIECAYDPWEDGIAIHYVFDTVRYMCVWFDYNSDGNILLYDKPLEYLLLNGDYGCM